MKFCARTNIILHTHKTYRDQFTLVYYEWNMHKFLLLIQFYYVIFRHLQFELKAPTHIHIEFDRPFFPLRFFFIVEVYDNGKEKRENYVGVFKLKTNCINVKIPSKNVRKRNLKTKTRWK